MLLSENVKVSSRYQRSVRIDSDIEDDEIIKSYVFPQSSIEVLLNMAKGVSEAGEASFTWTGPYGSGKSSLVVALSALLNKNTKNRKYIKKSFSAKEIKILDNSFGLSGNKGWQIVPLVGKKSSAEKAVGIALENSSRMKRKPKETSIEFLQRIAQKEECGVLLVIDEMGKFLESSVDGGFDIHFFQDLAEIAARSNGKIIVLGILHQAFLEYSKRLTRDIRDDWMKIQGRYIDMPLNVAGEELIDIISRAIISNKKPNKVSKQAEFIAGHIASWRPVNEEALSNSLTECWPLHPATAALLGPISRRRFGQNQRSVFGFLNSAEPYGFQNFLNSEDNNLNSLYSLPLLWDYLRSNLEPSIMASPDGHRWSMAVDAITRADANNAGYCIQDIIKCVALMDMFQERSGLLPDKNLLASCLSNYSKKEIDESIKQLLSWSILLYKKHKKSYSLYEGSDFDIDASLQETTESLTELNFEEIRNTARFQPIVAKKHYHSTGALRWMSVDLVLQEDAMDVAKSFKPTEGAMGLVLVVLGEKDNNPKLKALCKKISGLETEWPIITCVAPNSELIHSYAKETQALEWMKVNHQSLGGDTVARREVESRLALMKGRLEESFSETLTSARWYVKGNSPVKLDYQNLHGLTSDLADELYYCCPKINSELVNRIKPSSNSNAAMKMLLNLIVSSQGQERFGIEGYPAEGGLFETLISKTNLYSNQVLEIPKGKKDVCRIAPLFEQTDKYFKSNNKMVNITTLYEIWKKPPFGIKDGLLPFFAIIYLQTRIHRFASYLEGVYRPSIDNLFIDYLMRSPKDIALREMNFSDNGQKILAGVCDVLNEINPKSSKLSETSETLEIARSLVGTVMSLPKWVLKTQQLRKNSIKLRELIKNASDPNKVLFDDLPYLFKEYRDNLEVGDVQPIIEEIKISLYELVEAYPKLLENLKKTLFDELQIDTDIANSVKELNSRAKNIIHISGDFTLDAFAARLTSYNGVKSDIEGIASLAAGKPSQDWIDLDVSKAKLRIAELSQKFNHTETYGRVHNREDNRHAVAFMVGKGGHPKTYVREFSIKKSDEKAILKIEAMIKKALSSENEAPILLAALANVGADILDKDEPNIKSAKAVG